MRRLSVFLSTRAGRLALAVAAATGSVVPSFADTTDPLATLVSGVSFTNLETDDDLACRVARLIRTEQGITLAAVEFLQPSLRFWGSAIASFGHENSTAERIS